jgi:hypothetical protein
MPAWLIAVIVSVVILAVGALAYAIYNGFYKPNLKAYSLCSDEVIGNKLNGASSTAKVGATKESLFINLQPPTIAYAGLDCKDKFTEDRTIISALKGGIRSFILQVDMLDKEKAGDFAKPGDPTLLLRSQDGSLISENSGDISAVSTAIVNAGFTNTVPGHDLPIVLYIHVVRAPNQITKAAEYKTFLGKIAKGLAPLAPKHLGSNSLGNFHRQQKEDDILTMPLSAFSGNVIILCNADTSVFKGDSTTVQPANDLDYWVNMRVYALDTAHSGVGVAQKYSGSDRAYAIITSMDHVKSLSAADALSFGLAGKSRYVIAMTPSNPSKEDLNKAVNALGVNVVPINFLSENSEMALQYMGIYDNVPWPEKIASLRSK